MRMAKTLRSWLWHYRAFRIRAPYVLLVKRFGPTASLIKLPVPGSQEWCLVRPRSTDLEVYAMTLRDREYEFETSRPPRFIIDAGANIGLAAIHFAQRFPKAHIVAIEPDEGNFEMLCANVAAWPQVTPIWGALAAESGTVALLDPGMGSWGFRAVAAKDCSSNQTGSIVRHVRALTVSDVMSSFDVKRIDLLKLDIEGAEAAIMAASEPWIKHVEMICAELHDRYVRGCSLAFFQATRAFDFEWHRGENVFVARETSGVMPPA